MSWLRLRTLPWIRLSILPSTRSHRPPDLNPQRQVRRAQSRITAAERKRRTCRLILMGSYLEHGTQNDPVSMACFMKGLNEFLEWDRDRELFVLPPKPDSIKKAASEGS